MSSSTPSSRDDREILDPHAAEPGQVDPGLDRDDVARLERVGRLGREPRRLVHGEPDPVAEAVAEVLAEAGGRDLVARERVGLDAGHAGPDARARLLLRREADVVGLDEPRRR